MIVSNFVRRLGARPVRAFGVALLAVSLFAGITVDAQKKKPKKAVSPRKAVVPKRDPKTRELSAWKIPSLGEELRDLHPTDSPEEAAEYAVAKRSPDGRSPIPVEKYFTAIGKMETMRQYSTAGEQFLPSRAALRKAGKFRPNQNLGAWEPLGPGNVGGRTRALVIDPRNPSVMYAAGVAGGVWKSTDAGESWTALDDKMTNLAVCVLVMDPTDSNVLYAGTGEGFFNFGGVRGAGIFKTTNAGRTWTRLDGTATPDFFFVNDLVVSPNNPSRIYAGTQTGVWRSSDGGMSWTQIFDAVMPPTNFRGGCMDLAIRTDQQTDFLFAAFGTLSGPRSDPAFAQGAIFRIKNAASQFPSWERIYTEDNMGRTSLAISPSDQNVVYALISSIEQGSNYNRGLLAVMRSNDGGDSWITRTRNTDGSRLSRALLSNPIFALLTDCGGNDQFINQGWYDNVIAVDPKNSETLWVGGIDMFRSTDGGATWGLASYWWAGPPTIEEALPMFMHADHHGIVFHPRYDGDLNQTLFVVNDGGIYRSDNARTGQTRTDACLAPLTTDNYVLWKPLNNDYGVTQFYHGAVFPDGSTYFGGTQDNGTVLGSVSGGKTWKAILGGDGTYCGVDPTDANVLYASFPNFGFQKSLDGGQSFVSSRRGVSTSDGFAFVAPFAIDPTDSKRLWAGGRTMWRTTDAADNWEQASAPLTTPPNSSVTAIAIAPSNPNFMLVGRQGGTIHRTDQALTSTASTVWPSEANYPRAGFCSWLAFDPKDEKIAYATYATFGGTHVWKSTDSGATWTSLDGAGDGALPDIPVHCLLVDPNNTQRLFIGTDLGVFVSTDGGASWAVESTGFPNVVTESLAFAGNNQLFAFTHGRGVWRTDIRPLAMRKANPTKRTKR